MSDMPPHPAKLQSPERDASGYFSRVQQLTDGDLEQGVNAGRDDEDKITVGIRWTKELRVIDPTLAEPTYQLKFPGSRFLMSDDKGRLLL